MCFGFLYQNTPTSYTYAFLLFNNETTASLAIRCCSNQQQNQQIFRFEIAFFFLWKWYSRLRCQNWMLFEINEDFLRLSITVKSVQRDWTLCVRLNWFCCVGVNHRIFSNIENQSLDDGIISEILDLIYFSFLCCLFLFDFSVHKMSVDRRRMWFLAVVATSFLIVFVQSQFAPEKLIQNPCVSKTTCHECIQTKSCAWCKQPEFGDKPRCFQPSLTALTGSCPEEYTWNPDHEQRLVIARELTRAGSASISGGGTRVSGASISESSGHEHSESSRGSYSEHTRYSGHGRSGFEGAYQHNENVEYGQVSESGQIVQIYPQRVNLKLRISKFNLVDVRVKNCWN